MRALICVVSIASVAAAICFGAGDEKSKQNSTPGAKTTGGRAPNPANAVKPSLAKPTADRTPKQAGDPKVAKQDADRDEPPNKYADEEEAILKAGISFVVAYGDHDAKQVAAHFAPEAEVVDEEGRVLYGRDEIEASTAKVFKEHPQASLVIDVESLRFLSSVLAIETGTTTCTQDEKKAPHSTRYTAIHTKTDGQWFVASVREQELPGQRSARLQQLDWLVGNWIDETEDSVVHFNCQMTESGNYLVRDFEVTVAGQKVLRGTERTGWDPLSGKLRAWTFDSDGGHCEGAWHRDGDKWVLTSAGVTADGRSAAGAAVFTIVDGKTITWQAVDREIDGTRVEDSEEFTLVRSGPQPRTSDETPAN